MLALGIKQAYSDHRKRKTHLPTGYLYAEKKAAIPSKYTEYTPTDRNSGAISNANNQTFTYLAGVAPISNTR